jgi:hypothetical protein
MLSGQISNLLVVRNMEYDLPIVAGQATGELFVDGTHVPFRLRIDFTWNIDCWGGFRESRSLALGSLPIRLSTWDYKILLAELAKAYWLVCDPFTNFDGLATDDADEADGAERLDYEDAEARWLGRHNFAILTSGPNVVNEGGDALRDVIPDDFPGEAHGTDNLVVTSNQPRAFDCSEIPGALSLCPALALNINTAIHGLIRQIEASEVGFNGMSYEVTGEIDYNGRLVPLSYTLATAPAGDCTADIEEWSLVFGECADCIPIVVRRGDRSQHYAKIELGACEKDLPAWLHIECGQAVRALVMAQITDSGHLLPSGDDSVDFGKLFYGKRRVFREPLPIVLRSDSARPYVSPE